MAYEYTYGVQVTPNDSTVFDRVTRAIYVGTTGDVTVKMLTGPKANTANNEIKFVNVPAGTELKIRVSAVKSTGTTANNIVALF